MSYAGPRALLDAAFALGLLGLVLLLAVSLGWKMLRWMKLRHLTTLETAAFALPLARGILAYGSPGLGLAGLLRPWAIFGWLALLGVFTWREWSKLTGQLLAWLVSLPQALKTRRFEEKVC